MFAKLMAFLKPLAPVLEPVLLGAEKNQLVPEITGLIDKVSSPDLKLLLQALADGIEAFIEGETEKLA